MGAIDFNICALCARDGGCLSQQISILIELFAVYGYVPLSHANRTAFLKLNVTGFELKPLPLAR